MTSFQLLIFLNKLEYSYNFSKLRLSKDKNKQDGDTGCTGHCSHDRGACLREDAANGYITGFLFFRMGRGFFFHSNNATGTVMACDTGGPPWRWRIDPSTNGGQALLSALITAKNTHQLVKIYCPVLA